MTKFLPALAAACFALTAATSYAQAPAPGGEHKGPMAEHRHHMHERMESMRKACEGKPDRHACMTEQFCAKSEDKAKCTARMNERQAKMAQRMEQHQAIAEACTGKRGDELMKCYRSEAEKRGIKHGHHRKG